MKATLRHMLTPPSQAPQSLLSRVLQSNAPLNSSLNDGDGLDGGTPTQQPSGAFSSSSLISPTSDSAAMAAAAGGGAGINFESSGVTNPTTSASGAVVASVSRIKLVEVHPVLPLVVYVDNGSTGSGLANNSSKNGVPLSSSMKMMEAQRIVIQNYFTNQTLWTIDMAELAAECLSSSSSSSNSTSSNTTKKVSTLRTDMEIIDPIEISKQCRRLGLIKSVQFLDGDVVHWLSGGRTVYSSKGGSGSTSTSSSNPSSFPVSSLPAAHHTPTLVLQFEARILVYSATATVPPISSSGIGNRSKIIADIQSSDLNKASPTSTATPILTGDVLAVGCSDGAVRFYSVKDRRITKSVRGPNGRNDPVVKVVCANKFEYWKNDASGGEKNGGEDDASEFEKAMRQIAVSKSSNSSTNSNHSLAATSLKSSSSEKGNSHLARIITICASGLGFLWELQINFDKDRSAEKIKIRPPLLKMDGYGTIESNNLSSGSVGSSGGGGSSVVSGSASLYGQRLVENTTVVYDADRNYFIWSTAGGYNGSSKPHVAVWDLSSSTLSLAGGSGSGRNNSNKTSPETPLHRPFLVMQIPTGGGSSSNDVNFEKNAISGLLHPSFPPSALLCVTGSKIGDITITAASCGMLNSESNNTALVPAAQPKRAATYHHFSLASLKRSADEKVLGFLGAIAENKVRLYSMAASRMRPNVIVLATNVGIAVVNLEEDNALPTGSRHISVATHPSGGGTIGQVGAGGSIVLVEQSSVFTATLDYAPSTGMPHPVGPIAYKDPVLVYKSPQALNRSPNFTSRPVRMPPRLLPSPSGKFLCLFWNAESRYEILHVGSMLGSKRGIIQRNSVTEYAPAVDTGYDILSFAWVGDEDVFALLHPPERTKPESSTSTLSVYSSGTKDRKGIKKEVSKLIKRGGGGNATGTEDEQENTYVDPSKFKPRVELKVLVGVNADAVEISGSIAAATATILGDITLRGRHAPAKLFGGPVLCVGSLTRDGETSQSDGMAYFYCRRSNADENDNRASLYVSVGPSLPYPDSVVWDDEGRLCAVVVGRRIAIYLSDPPNFTLLGTALLGTANESDAAIESAKFLNGVLYCSTQSSIQCIFLGDLENDDNVCEVDSFVLASADGPLVPSRQFCQPTPSPMMLNRPSVLSYFHGSLLVSTVSGVQAVSMSHPIIRIGALLAAGHLNRAQRWFDAIPEIHHEALADFLERRGAPNIATHLPGISLETVIDLSLKYGLTEALENAIETHGVDSIRQIDMSAGVTGGSHSIVVCVGSYLLSQGKAELVRRLATECMTSGEEGRKEAFVLASLLLAVDASDARRLVKRAVTGRIKGTATPSADSVPMEDSWPVGAFVRDNLL